MSSLSGQLVLAAADAPAATGLDRLGDAAPDVLVGLAALPLVLADHSLVSAIPFLVPALVIIAFLGWHIVRDRRAGGSSAEQFHEDDDDWAPDPVAADPDA